MSGTLHGFGLGVASENANGDILDVFFPAPKASLSGPLADALRAVSGTLDEVALSALARDCRAANDEPTATLAERQRSCRSPCLSCSGLSLAGCATCSRTSA